MPFELRKKKERGRHEPCLKPDQPAIAGSLSLAIALRFSASSFMAEPNQPVTLNAQQVQELSRKLSLMRHDINNILSLVTAAVELMRTKPEMTERMIETVLEQPARIVHSVGQFSSEFQRILKVTGADI